MNTQSNYSRRDFLGTSIAGAAAASMFGTMEGGAAADAAPASAPPVEITRKIKLGAIGQGGRGAWITDLFRQHGGYEIHAVADYFPDRAKAAGDRFGVADSRRFSGLSVYKRLIESGVEAVLIESPPYFHPEQAAAAVEAGNSLFTPPSRLPSTCPAVIRSKPAGKRRRRGSRSSSSTSRPAPIRFSSRRCGGSTRATSARSPSPKASIMLTPRSRSFTRRCITIPAIRKRGSARGASTRSCRAT